MSCHDGPQRTIKDLEEAVFGILVVVYVAQYRRLMEVMGGEANIYREYGDTRSQTLVTGGSRSTDRDKSSGHSFALHCIHKIRRTNVHVKDVEVHWLQR